jgi:trk system potassium uptake protein TrkA
VHVVIVGGGLVGSSLAEKLSGDGHDVVLVEQDRELVAELNDRLDVQTIRGNGATVPVLLQAGIENCDLLLATTDSDEVNMVVALVGSTLFKVPRVVARLRHQGHEESFNKIASEIGGEMLAINPDEATVERIMSLLPVPGAVDVVPFFDGRLLVAGFRVRPDSEFAGLMLSHLRLLFPATPMLVVAIRRDGQWTVPHGEDEIQAGDLVYFAMDVAELDNVLTLLGLRKGVERKVMIAGATRIGISLAKRLEAEDMPATLIDAVLARCEVAAAELMNTVVVHGSPTDRSLLIEEGADRAESFVACTDDHEENVVACLLARQLGTTHTFALVDNPALAGLIGDLGIDAVISPRQLAVALALQFARKGRVKAVATLMEDYVEVIDVEAAPGSRLVSAPLAELGLPRGVLVAAVRRGDRLLVPKGDDRIQPADEVLLITKTRDAARLDPFLEGER